LKRRPQVYLLINLGYSLLYFFLVITFIGVIQVGLQGIFLAQLIAYSSAGLVAIWLGRDLVALTFSREWLYKMAAYGLPMLPAAILSWTLVAINRYYLNAFVGIDQVGYYSLAAKVSLAMSLVVSSFTLAWQPFMLTNLKNPDSPRLYAMTLNYYAMVSLLIAAGLAIFAREIVLILGTPAYLPSIGLVSILAVRQILPGMDYVTSSGIVITKKTIFYSIALGVGVLVNLLGNMLLTMRLGIYGAAISELCGVLAGSIVVFIVSNRLFPVKWNLRLILLFAAGYVVVVFLSFILLRIDLAPGWIFVIKLSVLIIYAIYLMWVIGSSERKLIYGFLKTLLSKLYKPSLSSPSET
jgi:O-antigen/teichoic acid export membrane protein